MVASRRNWDLSSTSLVILGAGFSRAATNGRAPLMCDFFSQLKRQRFPKLYDFVSQYYGSVAHADFEKVLQKIDGLELCQERLFRDWPKAARWFGCEEELRKQALDYAVERLKKGLAVPIGNWAASVLFSCSPTTTIISMNYDVVAECIVSRRPRVRHYMWGDCTTCAHCRLRLFLQRTCNCAIPQNDITQADWRGIILKPHGSISWRRCSNDSCCNRECIIADPTARPFEPCCCDECCEEYLPVIVMPDTLKKLKEIREIDAMWRSFAQAIADAESILFFGFRMPTSDELLASMMQDQISSKLKRIGVIDINPAAVLARIEELLPRSNTIDKIELPVVQGQTPDWLQNWNISCFPNAALRAQSVQVTSGGLIRENWLV